MQCDARYCSWGRDRGDTATVQTHLSTVLMLQPRSGGLEKVLGMLVYLSGPSTGAEKITFSVDTVKAIQLTQD